MPCPLYDPAADVNCIGPVAKSAAGDAFGSIAQSFGEAADHAANWLWGQMGTASAFHLGAPGFSKELELTAEIAATVAVALFVIQMIQSVLRREPAGLARALRGLAIAFLGGGVATAVVNLLLGTTDALCDGVVKATTGMSLVGLGRAVLPGDALTASIRGSAALLLLSLASIGATVVVYGAVVVRKLLIVVTAVFAPIALAGSLADVTVSWTRRWIETTVALIASKLVLVLVFVAGYETLISAGRPSFSPGKSVTGVISGIVVLFVAGFAPWMTLKIVRFTGERAYRLQPVVTGAAVMAAGGRMAQRAAPYVMRAAVRPAGAVAGAAAPAGGTAPPATGASGPAVGGLGTAGGTAPPATGASGKPARTVSTGVGTVAGAAGGTAFHAAPGRHVAWPGKAGGIGDAIATGGPEPSTSAPALSATRRAR